jgi:hypothetical protein
MFPLHGSDTSKTAFGYHSGNDGRLGPERGLTIGACSQNASVSRLAKTILRDYINATVGFAGLAEATHILPKSLMRMFGPTGNPRAANLLEIVSFLQQREGVLFPLRPISTKG